MANQLGLFRQGSGEASTQLTFTGLGGIGATAEVRGVRVTAFGRWF
jgi:hypothetical protein